MTGEAAKGLCTKGESASSGLASGRRHRSAGECLGIVLVAQLLQRLALVGGHLGDREIVEVLHLPGRRDRRRLALLYRLVRRLPRPAARGTRTTNGEAASGGLSGVGRHRSAAKCLFFRPGIRRQQLVKLRAEVWVVCERVFQGGRVLQRGIHDGIVDGLNDLPWGTLGLVGTHI